MIYYNTQFFWQSKVNTILSTKKISYILVGVKVLLMIPKIDIYFNLHRCMYILLWFCIIYIYKYVFTVDKTTEDWQGSYRPNSFYHKSQPNNTYYGSAWLIFIMIIIRVWILTPWLVVTTVVILFTCLFFFVRFTICTKDMFRHCSALKPHWLEHSIVNAPTII